VGSWQGFWILNRRRFHLPPKSWLCQGHIPMGWVGDDLRLGGGHAQDPQAGSHGPAPGRWVTAISIRVQTWLCVPALRGPALVTAAAPGEGSYPSLEGPSVPARSNTWACSSRGASRAPSRYRRFSSCVQTSVVFRSPWKM